MNKLTPYQVIANMGGETVGRVNELAYEVGLAFLDHMQEDEATRHELERSAIFWKWWTCQFERLTMQFVNSKPWDYYQGYSKAEIWRQYKLHAYNNKVSGWGERSYCQLMAEILEPMFRRKRKQEFERAGLVIVNQ